VPAIEQESAPGHDRLVKVGVSDADSTHVRLDCAGSNSDRIRDVVIPIGNARETQEAYADELLSGQFAPRSKLELERALIHPGEEH
jgi:hypothetical protein